MPKVGRVGDVTFVGGNLTKTINWLQSGSIGDDLLFSRLPADTRGRFFMEADGAMAFGNGTNVQDCYLWRESAGVLYLEDIVVLNKLGVNTSVAATTLGTVTRKVALYNLSGVVVGYIPVYDAIT